jgi:DNA-binding response OmpR family regulator
MAQTVLVADDEPKIAALVSGYLEASGFSVVRAYGGMEALEAFASGPVDCVILDINMPGLDGLGVAREIRKSSATPIIFLTARTDEMDRIVGFELGADDYVQKPFSPRELVARVKAILRRVSPAAGPESRDGLLVRGTVIADPAKRALTVRGAEVVLTAAQFDLLVFMMREPGRVWSRLDLLGASSGSAFEGYERTVDAQVKNIRRALGDDSEKPCFIETVRGVGYRFMEQVHEA